MTYRRAIHLLDLAAFVCLVLAVVCLTMDFGGLQVRIAGKKILSVTQFERPWFFFLGLSFARVLATFRWSPPEVRARYRTGWRRLVPRLALLAGTVLVLATLLETGFQLFYHRDPLPTVVSDPAMWDKTRGRFRPGSEGVWCGSVLVTDDRGFRARNGRPAPAPGDRKILVLGDSIAYGVALPTGKTFPFRAEELLDERGIPVHLYNSSIPGLRTRNEYEILAEHAPSLRPDLVVLVWCFNDALPDPEPWPPLASRLSSRLTSFGWYYTRLTSNPSRFNPPYINQCYEPDSAPWIQAREYLKKIRDLARAEGFEFRVAIFPLLDYLEDYPFHPAHESLTGFLEAEGIEYRDWIEIFEGKDSSTTWVHPGDHHPGEEACELAAQDLADYLEPILRNMTDR